MFVLYHLLAYYLLNIELTLNISEINYRRLSKGGEELKKSL